MPTPRLAKSPSIVLYVLALVACSDDPTPKAPSDTVTAGSCAAASCVGAGTGGAGAGSGGASPGTSGAGGGGAGASTAGAASSAGSAAGGAGGADAAVSDPDAGVTGPGTVIAEPQDEAAVIYDPTQIQLFELELAQSDLDAIDADPAAEQYVPARLTHDGTTYDVGYRYKGSIGAFQPPCTMGNFGGNGGPRIGKCSSKVSFNFTDPEARFFGLKKLQFHSMNMDPSMLRERLGYGLFRAMGVPAPRVVHAILSVNGQADIYALVEEVDSRFTRSRFTEGGTGNLYKEIWPVHEGAQPYLDALETNEDDAPQVERMLRFKDATLAGPAAMTSFLDLDVTTSYMAVDRVILNDDGAFHFYCIDIAVGNNPTIPGNHNYYWYEAANVDRFWIIPWDLDHSMNDFGPVHIPVDWRVPQTECPGCTGGGGFGQSPAPACDPAIENLHALLTDYEAKVDAFLAGPFSKPEVDAKLDDYTAQLTAAGYAPPSDAVEQLRMTLDRVRETRGFPY